MDVSDGAAGPVFHAFAVEITDRAAGGVLEAAVRLDVPDGAAGPVFHTLAIEIADRAAGAVLDTAVGLDVGDGAARTVFDALGARLDPVQQEQGCKRQEKNLFHQYQRFYLTKFLLTIFEFLVLIHFFFLYLIYIIIFPLQCILISILNSF